MPFIAIDFNSDSTCPTILFVKLIWIGKFYHSTALYYEVVILHQYCIVKWTRTASINDLGLLNELWGNIKTRTWNIWSYMLQWTYNVSKVTAYVTKKAPPCHRWGFLLPSKRVNHYFLRFLSHSLKSSDNTLISNGARNTVSKVSNICNTSLL